MSNFRINSDFLDSIKSRVSLRDYIASTGVELKSMGKNAKAQCPFPAHDDKTPSFNVIEDKDFCYCHGCGEGGDIFEFAQKSQGLDFVEAVKAVAIYAGVDMPVRGNTDNPDPFTQVMSSLLERAKVIYQSNLAKNINPEINNLLRQRNINEASVKKFEIGVAKADWNQVRNFLGGFESKNILNNSGLCVYSPATGDSKEKLYDRFRDGLIFPIKDIKGNVKSFAIRHKDNVKPKYMNGPESDLFKKSHELYGLYESSLNKNQKDGMYVVEGYIDVIKMDQHAIPNAVAPMGTSLTEKQVQTLIRKTNNLTFCFDSDAAGLKAAKRALLTLLPYVDDHHTFKFAILPEGLDPDSMLEKHGASALVQHLKNAIPLSEFVFKVFWEGKNQDTREHIAQAANEFCGMLEKIPECNFKRDLAKRFEERTGLPLKQSLTISVSGKDLLPSKVLEVSKSIRTLVSKVSGAKASSVDVKISNDNYKPTSNIQNSWRNSYSLPSSLPPTASVGEKMDFLNKGMESVLINSNLKVKDDSGIPIIQLLMDSFKDSEGNAIEDRLKVLSQFQLKVVLEKHDFVNMLDLLNIETHKLSQLAMHICQNHSEAASEVQSNISQFNDMVHSNIKYLEGLGRFCPNETYALSYSEKIIALKKELRIQSDNFKTTQSQSLNLGR